MKKLLIAVMCIALVPMLFAVDIADDNPPDDAIRTESYDPNAMTNPLPSNGPVQIDDGRALGDILMTIDLAAIGMPGDGYDNGGLTWDGQYLYIDNMYNNNIYVVDPTGPTLVGNFAAPPTLSWGIGHEQNLWITEVYAFNAYEYTYAGTPTGNSFYCLQGGASWMGDASEWWPDGEIWILAVGGTNRLYKFSVPAGTYLTDVGDATYTYISQRGLTYDPWNDMFWVGGWNSDMVWEANASDGSVTGRSFPFISIASLAYDWQSTLHPEPVLWLASNDLVNYIYMIDPDNPQPVTSIVWDFEDGWQGWIHTNGMSFPAAWERKEFDYKASYAVPSAGDTSMWIDSDAISGTWVQDTALSPAIVPAATMDWLKYGVGYNDVGTGDFYEVGIKYYDGANWTVVPLVTYTADIMPGMWDSVDVSAYAGYDYVQVYFYYDDANSWAWYAVFDNVTIAGTIPSAHDVGCNMITSPPAGDLIPAGTYDVIGNIKNFGDFAETFDATAEVWDTTTWTQVFTQTTTFTDLAAGAESLHTFGNVTFETDKVYYTMIYTELVDDNPANDTSSIYSNTIIPDYYWEILDPPLFPLPSAGHSEATMHDGYYYVFGLQSGSVYLDTFIIYDIAGNQWLDGGTNPAGASRYGTANHVNGRFYVLGGTAAWPTPNQWISILEPPGTWTAGATPPIAMMDQMTGVYKDSLLFVFGAGEWSMTPITDVYFYDTYTDAWTTCTSFPAPGRGAMAGGVIDSFAVLAFGYTSGSNYDNNYCVGIIDETDPSSITWGSWAPVPGGAQGVRRVPSGVDEFNGELWVIGGQISGGQLDRTLSYDPYTDTWTDWNTPKPQSICNLTPIPVTTTTMGDLGVFCGGGYASGAYIGNHEVFHTGNYTGIAENPGQQGTSSRFGFAPSMPNPTKSYAAISYTTTNSGPVSVRMYDGTGRLVKTLVDRVIEPAGTKTVYWNGKDDAHRDIPNGVYFLRLEAEGQVDTHKMIFVR